MATNPYVNKVVYGNNTVMDISDSDVQESDVANGKVFYKGSGERSVGTATGGGEVSEDLLRDTVGWTGKNLLENKLQNGTSADVQITVGNDGVITLNGTASSTGYNSLHEGLLLENGVSYTISSGADIDMVGMYVNAKKLDDSYAYSIATLNNPTFTADSSLYKSYDIGIAVVSGKVYSNFIMYPMLRRASTTNADYEPYHESVKQTLRDYEVIDGKNLLCIDGITTSDESNGITYTVIRNASGDVASVRVNGTATADSSCYIGSFVIQPYEQKLTCNGTRSDGKVNLRLGIKASESDAAGSYYTNIRDDEATISTSTNAPYGIAVRINVENGTTVSNVDLYPLLRNASESADYEPYYIPLKDSKFGRAEQRVLGAKNVLPITASSADIFTVNANGSVTINGTGGTGGSAIDLGKCTPASNWYIISGGNVVSGVAIIVQGFTGTTWSKNIIVSENAEDEFVIDYDGYDNVNVRIRVLEGTSVSNQTYYPMLRLASDPDSTYVPYAMTNKELTDKAYTTDDTAETTIADDDYFPYYDTSASAKRKTLWSSIKSALQKAFMPYTESIVTGARNLMHANNDTDNVTINGITFYNSYRNGMFYCVTATGTATDDAVFVVNKDFELEPADYKLGGISGGSESTFYIELCSRSGNSIVQEAITTDGSVNFTSTSFYTGFLHHYFIRIVVKSGTTLSNKAFFPLIISADSHYSGYTHGVKSNQQLTNDAPVYVGTMATVAKGGTVRIPAGTGTNSNIKTNSQVVIVCNNGTGKPAKITSYEVNDGYIEVVMAEALSDKEVGAFVFNLNRVSYTYAN